MTIVGFQFRLQKGERRGKLHGSTSGATKSLQKKILPVANLTSTQARRNQFNE